MAGNTRNNLKIEHQQIWARGFTLIELLVVIAIIGILAGVILSALSGAKESVRKTQARADMKTIESAIQAYHSAYSRYPTPTNLMTTDFTFGPTNGTFLTGYGPSGTNNNCDIMAILVDDADPNIGTGCNNNHQKNPQRTPFLQVNRSTSINAPGLGPDLVYRDPWGNAYFITIDYDFDDLCLDNFYKLKEVSAKNPVDANDPDGGYNALRTFDKGTTFALKGSVMIWSMGGPMNKGANSTTVSANQPPNSTHILGWTK